jgi:hypothetical protein
VISALSVLSENGVMQSALSLPTHGKLVLGCGAVAALCLLRYASVRAYARCQFLRRQKSTPSENQVVFITGCDSGLGFSCALHAHKLGYTVVAGCLQANGEGKATLLQLCAERLHVISLDVTSGVSVQAAAEAVRTILARDPHYGRPTRGSTGLQLKTLLFYILGPWKPSVRKMFYERRII